MPLYDYHCSQCGEITDVWAKMHEMIKPCPQCKGVMDRLISPCAIRMDISPYFDENLGNRENPQGRWINSRQQKRQVMKEEGLEEIG